jgi:hypothetical protein
MKRYVRSQEHHGVNAGRFEKKLNTRIEDEDDEN